MIASLFLQNQTPDTVSYLILGYVIIGVVGLGYVISLALRQRSLKRELEMLARLQDEDKD